MDIRTDLLPKGISYPEAASIGRVVTSPSVRGQNLGKQLMNNSIEHIHILFGEVPVKISAQLDLKDFYESFSFIQKGSVYPGDGIDHITMERKI